MENEMVLQQARCGGFIVLGSASAATRSALLYAGTLDACVDFIRRAFQDAVFEVYQPASK